MTTIEGRKCAICGKRKGNTEGFNTTLFLNEIPGEKAHPKCVKDFFAVRDKLFELRCKSKYGQALTAEQLKFLNSAHRRWPLAYSAMNPVIFRCARPFGAQ
jgi:hypothetical protein